MKTLISVLTPSIRKPGLALVEKALKRQTFDSFEWLVGSTVSPELPLAKHVVDDFKGGIWSLNRIYNRMIEKATGELLVSWQDYTFANPDALSRFWNCYYDNPQSIISGVGNKYKDDTWTVKTWQDPRQRSDQGSFYECYPWDVEGNFSAWPKQALLDVGGFDEQMDFEGYGFDARGVMERIDLMGGYKFYLDQQNESFSLEHDRPEGWDENNFITKWPQWKQKNLDSKCYPVLKYLTTK